MVKLGLFMFKNINEPIDIYAMSNPGIVVPNKNELTRILRKIKKKKSRRGWNSIGAITLFLFLLTVLYIKKSFLQESELTEKNANDTDQQKSIAVIPFQNLSTEQEFSFFSVGVVDNILTKLGKLQELHVISRSSSKIYANSQKTLSEIALELGVTFILEGSVQKYGNHVRINAQLIDVHQDKQLWAEQYDRELNAIFQLQNEVSIKIIEALKINLSAEMKNSIAETNTKNLQAWENFVLSKELISQRTSQKLIQGIDIIELALMEDPNFAEAMTLQAEALFVCGRFGYLDRKTSFVKARNLISRALSINPKLGGPYAILGVLDFDEGRWEDCLKNCEQALIYSPNDPLPNRSYAYCLGRITKNWNKTVEFAKKCYQLDPLSQVNFYQYLNALLNAGRLNDLETEIRVGHVSFDNQWMEMQFTGLSSATQGNFEEAIPYFKSAMVLNPENENIKSDLGFCLGKIGQSEEAKAILDKLNIDSPNFHLYAAIIYSGMGDLDAAFDNLEIKFSESSSGLIDMLAGYQSIPLQIDIRFENFIKKMNLHNYWGL
jgi:TolB-like protein